MKKEEQKAINWVCDKMFDIAKKSFTVPTNMVHTFILGTI